MIPYELGWSFFSNDKENHFPDVLGAQTDTHELGWSFFPKDKENHFTAEEPQKNLKILIILPTFKVEVPLLKCLLL